MRPSTFTVPASWAMSIRLVSDPARVTSRDAEPPEMVKRSTVALVSSVVLPAALSVTS